MMAEYRLQVMKPFVRADIINGDTKLHASDADDSRPKAGFIECFPCGTTPRNVCSGELAAFGFG